LNLDIFDRLIIKRAYLIPLVGCIALLDVGPNQARPSAVMAWQTTGRQGLLAIVKHVNRETDLLQIVLALRATGCFARGLNRRQQ
jgi:hypothetical protein